MSPLDLDTWMCRCQIEVQNLDIKFRFQHIVRRSQDALEQSGYTQKLFGQYYSESRTVYRRRNRQSSAPFGNGKL